MSLKDRMRADLTTAMKARDELRKSTLRMVLTGITNEEVAGDTARRLTDAEIITVLARETKKRKEAAEAFDGAGRTALADRERAESAVIAEYLPSQLGDAELAGLVDQAVAAVAASTGAPITMKQLGLLIKHTQAAAASRADGARISAAVKAAISR